MALSVALVPVGRRAPGVAVIYGTYGDGEPSISTVGLRSGTVGAPVAVIGAGGRTPVVGVTADDFFVCLSSWGRE